MLVDVAQIELAFDVPLFGGPHKPFHRLSIVLRNAFPSCIEEAKQPLSRRNALPGQGSANWKALA